MPSYLTDLPCCSLPSLTGFLVFVSITSKSISLAMRKKSSQAGELSEPGRVRARSCSWRRALPSRERKPRLSADRRAEGGGVKLTLVECPPMSIGGNQGGTTGNLSSLAYTLWVRGFLFSRWQMACYWLLRL